MTDTAIGTGLEPATIEALNKMFPRPLASLQYDVPRAAVVQEFSDLNVDDDRVAEASRILTEKNIKDIALHDRYRDALLSVVVS